MLTKKTPKPELEMRKSANPSEPLHEDLANKMKSFWGRGRPSECPLAPGLVYETGFMRIKEPSSYLKKKLYGKRLIDLGAGNTESVAAMAHFAAVMGASEYIAVDGFIDYGRLEPFLEDYICRSNPKLIVRAFNDDILLFLSKMRGGSANIVMNSIDRCMLVAPSHFVGEMYGIEIASEMARVVMPGGIVFGVNSPNLERLLQFGFMGRYENPGYIYTKGDS